MPKSKKQRVSKTSSGMGIKHKRTRLSNQQKILLNGGMLVGVADRWKVKR